MGLRGPKKGSHLPSTLHRRRAEMAVKMRIARAARRLVNAQLSVALGTQYLMCKPSDPRIKAFVVTDQDVIRRFLDGDLSDVEGEYYYITTEKPDAVIADKMLDRAFGKEIGRAHV